MALTTGPASEVRSLLLQAAVWFVRSAAGMPGILRIACIGSILTGRREPKDVDLLVYVAGDTDLVPLAALGRRLQGRLQSHARGADVFLADEDGRYLGRTCHWKVCGPGSRASCDALHCGRRPYLHDDLATVRLDAALVEAPPLELWPAVVRRCAVPADVERMLADLAASFDAPRQPAPGA